MAAGFAAQGCIMRRAQVKEILGTCVSVGCTVDHEEPRDLQAKVHPPPPPEQVSGCTRTFGNYNAVAASRITILLDTRLCPDVPLNFITIWLSLVSKVLMGTLHKKLRPLAPLKVLEFQQNLSAYLKSDSRAKPLPVAT